MLIGTIFGGGHEVDGNGVHGGMLGYIEESVLFFFLHKVMLWCEENVWHKLQEPGW